MSDWIKVWDVQKLPLEDTKKALEAILKYLNADLYCKSGFYDPDEYEVRRIQPSEGADG